MTITFPEPIKILPRPVLGRVERSITPTQRGRVAALGSIWYARFCRTDRQETAMPNEAVMVVGIQGITLLVMSPEEMTVNPCHPYGLSTSASSSPTWQLIILNFRQLLIVLSLLISMGICSQLPSELTALSYHTLFITRVLAKPWLASDHGLH